MVGIPCLMKTTLSLLFGLLLGFGAHAQTPTHRHSFGVGFERVGLDAPDAIGNRCLLNYSRHFRHDRLVVGANLGYLSVSNKRYLANTNHYYVYGKRRERVSADVTLAFDLLKQARHALRLGAGPSLWYRQDELLDGGRYTVNVASGEVTDVQLKWRQEKALNYGFNVLVEYEYALTDQLLVSGKVKFADLNKAGQSAIYGVGIGYRLQ
ncbi:hypothetical protein SAMN04515668_4399 [Hymenobacter arizonensis]|uniref:Outer membrane protein beta-barrel domain-containing protein n=2 Tax=Hymenobacter arizonensis TaxID=1227077 RepID=A0A1I6BDR5_HYMAR|nr:hypothetical protein SAMN04515668_4399 [Hymenobacter arizonensis]